MTLRQRLNWFALHAVIRKLAAYGARHGDLQGRLIADPAVRTDPGAFADELRSRGRMYRGRAAWITAEAVAVMEYHGSAEDIARMVHGHPSLTESVGEAARAAWLGMAIHA